MKQRRVDFALTKNQETIMSQNTEKDAVASNLKRIVKRMEDVKEEIDAYLENRELIVVWTQRHINNTVWVIATDAELEVDRKYQTTPGSEFPTKFFKVHDKWKPDSLNRYLVTEILNKECA